MLALLNHMFTKIKYIHGFEKAEVYLKIMVN